MHIIGNGFLAHNLQGMVARHTNTVVVAAGVSSTLSLPQNDYDREERLLKGIINRFASHQKLIVFFSTASSAMYGGLPFPATETSPVRPPLRYGQHKRRLEVLLASSNMDYLIVRLSNAVGVRQPEHQLVPFLVHRIASGHSVPIRDGAKRDLIDVEDVVKALDALLVAGVRRDIVNVASAVTIDIESIVAQICNSLKLPVRMKHSPWGQEHSLKCEVSIDKLRSLSPNHFQFDSYYPLRVLERYVHYYAG